MQGMQDSKMHIKTAQSPTTNSQLISPTFSPVSISHVNSTENLDNLHSCRSQVCDRCRKLKKKCYGTGPVCNNCLISNNQCTITATLKRKRKPKPTKLNPIEIENIKLKLKIQQLENALQESEHSKMLHAGTDARGHPIVKLEDISYHSLSSSQPNSMDNSAMHSPISNDETYTIMTSDSSSGSPKTVNSHQHMNNIHRNHGNNGMDGNTTNGISKKRQIKNITSSDFKHIVRTRSLKFDLTMMSSMSKILLPNEDNYNGPAIIEEYSIVDNFLQQDFIKILKEQKPNINHYMDRFFTEMNILFPIILEKDYMLMKTDELMKSIDVRNFNTNVINDEHNLCIVYKVILISLFYIKDSTVRNSYLKTVKHLLSRFEFLDPINTLKCYLLTHLFAQMSNNKPLLVRMNGLISSLAINLRINKYKDCNELKRELWYVCYCFDFFCNDPNNLDYSLNRYFNDIEFGDDLDDIDEKDFAYKNIDSSNSMRMINDHTVLKNMGDSKFVLQVIDIKRAVYSNEITVHAALKQLLNLHELRRMAHLDLSQDDKSRDVQIPRSEYQYHFHISFALLYYMDTLIFLQNSYIKSLKSKQANSFNQNNSNKQLRTLFYYIETMLTIWTVNIEKYDHIPLININKLFQFGIFIHWYATNGNETHRNTAELSNLKSAEIRKSKSENGEQISTALNMIIDLLNRHTFVDDNIKNCRDVLMGLLLEIMPNSNTEAVVNPVVQRDQIRPSKKIKTLDVLPSPVQSLNISKSFEQQGQFIDTKAYKSYELISGPYSKTNLSPEAEVEEQLNNYVSGFTFDSRHDTFTNTPTPGLQINEHNDTDIIINININANNNDNNSCKRDNTGELFNSISDNIDLKKINLNTNDFYEIKFEP